MQFCHLLVRVINVPELLNCWMPCFHFFLNCHTELLCNVKTATIFHPCISRVCYLGSDHTLCGAMLPRSWWKWQESRACMSAQRLFTDGSDPLACFLWSASFGDEPYSFSVGDIPPPLPGWYGKNLQKGGLRVISDPQRPVGIFCGSGWSWPSCSPV